MESVDLDMGDLFDEEAMDDDDVGTVSALPDLPEYREGGDGDGEGGEPGENEDAGKTRGWEKTVMLNIATIEWV